jgi:predicted nucleic acid-binding protein
VVAPSRIDKTISEDPGEREAICLALELKADLLLVDDKQARRAARQSGLRITGTVGVLELAGSSGVVNLADALHRIRSTDFFISDDLIQEALGRARNNSE